MKESLSFTPLLLVIFLAFAVPMLLTRFKLLKLPIVVGELIAGIIVGRSGFGWVEHHDPVLDLLAEFGFVFLMFLSGMEIDFNSLRSVQGSKKTVGRLSCSPLQLGLITFALTLTLSAGIGVLFYHFDFVQDPWMMALILSTTSLGVVVPVLKEKGISSGGYGQTLLVSALIADFATMFLITVLVAVLSKGLSLEILLVGVLFVAFFFMYRFGIFFFNRWKVVRRTIDELSSATAQIKVRAAFTIMLVFVALSEKIGTEIILGAFMAGAIVSLLKRPEDESLENELNAIGFGFFIPIFFIMVGVDFNLSALTDSPRALVLALLLIVSALFVKFVPALVFKLVFSWKQTLGAGVLLSSRLSLIIAASSIGLRLGIIDQSVNSAIVLVSLITVSLGPTIFSRMIPSAEEEEGTITLVAGASELGLRVAEHLALHHDKVILIAKNERQKRRAKQRDLQAVIGRIDVVEDARLKPLFENARSMVCVYNNSETSYQAAKLARQVYGVKHIVCRVDDPQEMERFASLGVLPMNIAIDRAALLAVLVRNPGMYNLLTRTDDDKDIAEVWVRNPTHFGKRIRDMVLPDEVLILALNRDGQFLIPSGDTRLEAGDRLSLLCKVGCLEIAERYFHSKD